MSGGGDSSSGGLTTLQLVERFVDPARPRSDHIEGFTTLLLRLEQKQIVFSDVVGALGDYLTARDELLRARGTLLLAELLAKLPNIELPSSSSHHFVLFFSSRLEHDDSSVAEVLKGLVALFRNQSLQVEDVRVATLTVLREVRTQGLNQVARGDVYKLLSITLDKYLNAIKGSVETEEEFISGFVDAMSGEKDPRNLVVCLEIFKKVVEKLRPTFAKLSEDLFDVVSCYFPITFRLRPDDPDAVKPEHLRLALREVLCMDRAFTKWAIPFLLEKLSSSVVDTKLESLVTLTTAIQNFGPVSVYSFLEAIWKALKIELMHAATVNEKLEESTLLAIKEITKVLANNTEGEDDEKRQHPLRHFLELLTSSCDLSNDDIEKVNSSGKTLLYAAAASSLSCSIVLEATFPSLLADFSKSTENSKRSSLITLITQFVKFVQIGSSQQEISSSAPNSVSPLKIWKDRLLEIYNSTLSDEVSTLDLKSLAITGLADLSSGSSTSVLSPEEVQRIVIQLTELLLNSRQLSLRLQCLRSLTEIASQHLDVILQHTLTSLLETLKTSMSSPKVETILPPVSEAEESTAGSDGRSNEEILQGIALLSTNQNVFQHVFPKVVELLLAETEQKRDSSALILLRGVQALIDMSKSNIKSLSEAVTVFVPKILSVVIHRSCTDSSVSCDFVRCLASTFQLLARNVDESVQKQLVREVAGSFDEQKDGLKEFRPLLPSSPASQHMLLSLVTAIMSSVRSSVQDSTYATGFIDRLLEFALSTNPQPSLEARLTATKCLASMLNKLPGDEPLTQQANKTVDRLRSLILSESGASQVRLQALWTLVWVSKALIVRNHGLSISLTQSLVEFLSLSLQGGVGAELSREASLSYGIILDENDESSTYIFISADGLRGVISKLSFSIIKPLYKQKLFTQTAPLLLSGFHSTTTTTDTAAESKGLYLTALGGFLHHLPRSVLLSELPSVFPLLIQSLAVQTPTSAPLLLSTLKTFKSLVVDAPKIIGDHISTLVPLFLKLSRYPQSMQVRIHALECLTLLTGGQLPFFRLFPTKDQVTNELVHALDDKKRLVRKEASKCRNAWFLLSS